MQQKLFLIPEALLAATLNYLNQCPRGHVNQICAGLENLQEINPDLLAQPEPQPEIKKAS